MHSIIALLICMVLIGVRAFGPTTTGTVRTLTRQTSRSYTRETPKMVVY